MTQEQFTACKSNFLATYGEILCEDSLSAIEKANTPQAFIMLLHEFATFLRYKVLPSAEWARKWFGSDVETLNECGVYLDQTLALEDPQCQSLVLLGTSDVMVTLNKGVHNITLQDESNVRLIVFGVARCTVREKGKGHATEVYCENPKDIKIHKI